jgi:hypothetical protein
VPCWVRGAGAEWVADGAAAGLVPDADGAAARERVGRVLLDVRGTRAVLTLMGCWVQDPAAAELQVSADREVACDGEVASDGEDGAMAERDGAGAGPRVR